MRWTIVFCPSVVEKGRLHHCTMEHGVHKYSAGGGSMSIGTRCYDDFWEVKKENRFWRILVRTIAISTKFPGSASPVLSSVSNQLQADHRPESIIKCGTGMAGWLLSYLSLWTGSVERGMCWTDLSKINYEACLEWRDCNRMLNNERIPF